MKLITKRDMIAGVPQAWRISYRTYNPDNHLNEIYCNGGRKRTLQIQQELDALDLATCTEQDIADIIGNGSWTRLICRFCKKSVGLVVCVTEDTDAGERELKVCPGCIAKASSLLAGVLS